MPEVDCGSTPAGGVPTAGRTGRGRAGVGVSHAASAERAVEGVVVVVVYLILAFVLLYPLFAHPTHQVIDPTGGKGGAGMLGVPDVNLMIWILAWGWHALTTRAVGLFDANIYYPAPLTFAGAEHLLGNQPIFGPVYAVSGNPVLANQVNLWLIFALCGAAMYAFLRHSNVSRPAAFFGGFVYAFCPIRTHYGPVSIQSIAVQYLPLVLLFMDRTLQHGSARSATAACFFLLLQMLCGYYVAYMSLIALVGYGLGILWNTRGHLRLRAILLATAGVMVACALFAAISLPYLDRKRLGAIPEYQKSQRLAIDSTEPWRNYLYPPIAMREWGWHPWKGLMMYVGLVPLSLGLLELMPRRRREVEARGWAVAACFGLTLGCYTMALGREIRIGDWTVPLPYKLAMEVIPGFSSMRAPSRFGFILMLGAAALAGMGMDRVLAWLRERRASWWIGATVVVLTTVTAIEYDLLRFRYAMREADVGDQVPAVYRALAQVPPGPVLEIPVHGLEDYAGIVETTYYLYYSTFHWQNLLNGYSQYPPATDAPMLALARILPDARATYVLARITGLRYVVVHTSKLQPVDRTKWAAPAGLQLIGSFGDDLLFQVPGAPSADLMPTFIDFTPRTTTVLAHPLMTVPESARQNRVTAPQGVPSAAASGLRFWLEVVVTNRSRLTWPALAPVGDHLVAVGYRWETPDGNLQSEDLGENRIPYDLGPGESTRVLTSIVTPTVVGPHRFYLGVVQDGVWFPGRLGPIPITVMTLTDLLRPLTSGRMHQGS